jgi:enoyl-CoA hydratase/carnithine racemase
MIDATTYEVEAGVATITLNRPDNRNALSIELMNSLGDNFESAMSDDAVRVVVFTNEGNTFCAGANLKGESGDELPRYSLEGILARMMDGPKPVVGRIAGHCTGGGNGLAAACDLSIAADDVFFAFTEVRIGVAPAIISVVCLPKMRRADALELFLTGRRAPAAHAAEIGLINRAVSREELDTAVSELTAELVAGGPKALAAAKELVYKVPGMDRTEAFAWTAKLSAELFESEEAGQGIAAFREKSTPPWVPNAGS